MNETEFRAFATANGYRTPEMRSQPANKFFDTHAHAEDLAVLITEGRFTVDYGGDATDFGPGEMCEVAAGVDHTDAVGPEGASYVMAWRAVAD